MDIPILVKLTSRAWSLKILALLHEGVPGRQAPLIAAAGAGRTAFAASLDHLIEMGFLERNPGHGHPLRPEFRLTAAGRAIAPLAHRIERVVQDPAGAQLLRRAWTVPLLAVAQDPVPFSAMKRALDPITDRSLSNALKSLDAQAWIARRVEAAHRPPRPLYVAANEGAEIARALAL